MKHNKFMLVFGLVVIASMVLSACQPQTIIQTVEVEKVVEVEKTVVAKVEVEKVVEQTKIVEVRRRQPSPLPHPILGDLKVRQALAYCTNKADLAQGRLSAADRRTGSEAGDGHLYPQGPLGLCR